MRVAIVGTGYVGLVTGTCLAEIGWEVVCVDRSAEKIEALKRGQVPIYEPGLDELVARNAAARRLSFTQDMAEAVRGASVVMIAVGTPPRALDGNADLCFVFEAAGEIALSLEPGAVVVTKSTVPAGTGFEVRRAIAAARPDLSFEIASNPEFLREGSAIADFMRPDRIVVGTESEAARAVLERLYAPFAAEGVEIVWTDIVSSELIKYAANTFLATKVSFINEMADLCEQLGGNIEDVAKGMGSDRRIGHAFLRPGPGYGGSCFPKDTRAMVHIGEEALSPVTIVEAVIAVNRARTHRMVQKIVRAAGAVRGRRIALLGLTFKADTDDVRDSVAILIAEKLAQLGAEVVAYDPKGMDHARAILGEAIGYAGSTDEALAGAEICVLATEWAEFRALTAERLASHGVVQLIDLRNLFAPAEMAKGPVRYVSVGRPEVGPLPSLSAEEDVRPVRRAAGAAG